MQVTRCNYPVFTTNVQNAKISGLGTDSTKRLIHHCGDQFHLKQVKDGPLFDNKTRNVLRKYELKPGEINREVKYLDSIRYGGEKDPSQLFQQIERFQQAHAPSFQWNKNYQRALRKVEKLTTPMIQRLKILEYRSDEDIKDALPKPDAHSGFEFIVTGLKEKGMYIEGARDHFEEELHQARMRGSFCKPIITLNRLQCSGAYDAEGNRTGECKKKTRLVSAVDIWVVIAELMWAKPFQRFMASRPWYVGGKKPWELRANVGHNRWHHKQWISLDYSKFDQSLPAWLIRDAFNIIWKCFQGCENWRWLWDIIVNDFIKKAFVGPDGTLFYAENGVPSGSMFTQIIDSICNLIMVHTYFYSLEAKGHKISDFVCIICGDDNLVFLDFDVDFEDLEGYFKRNFGVECNASKCDRGAQTDDPVFLSRFWQNRGEWRLPKELIAKMLYPERFRPYRKNPQLTPEAIVYSYILAFPLGMEELIDVRRFMKDNVQYLRSWSSAIFEYQSGYLSYVMRYENSLL
uniref:RNA-dependent RNA polymerase n=1 Tax=Davola partiti-like virus TaxID=2716658 RepID=A0A6G7PS02_9VIRU|nr:RNA-dependent RNA polymerase [Davola partiti-like virus]